MVETERGRREGEEVPKRRRWDYPTGTTSGLAAEYFRYVPFGLAAAERIREERCEREVIGIAGHETARTRVVRDQGALVRPEVGQVAAHQARRVVHRRVRVGRIDIRVPARKDLRDAYGAGARERVRVERRLRVDLTLEDIRVDAVRDGRAACIRSEE